MHDYRADGNGAEKIRSGVTLSVGETISRMVKPKRSMLAAAISQSSVDMPEVFDAPSALTSHTQNTTKVRPDQKNSCRPVFCRVIVNMFFMPVCFDNVVRQTSRVQGSDIGMIIPRL